MISEDWPTLPAIASIADLSACHQQSSLYSKAVRTSSVCTWSLSRSRSWHKSNPKEYASARFNQKRFPPPTEAMIAVARGAPGRNQHTWQSVRRKYRSDGPPKMHWLRSFATRRDRRRAEWSSESDIRKRWGICCPSDWPTWSDRKGYRCSHTSTLPKSQLTHHPDWAVARRSLRAHRAIICLCRQPVSTCLKQRRSKCHMPSQVRHWRQPVHTYWTRYGRCLGERMRPWWSCSTGLHRRWIDNWSRKAVPHRSNHSR